MSAPKPPTQQPPPAPPASPFGRLQLSTFLATGLVALVAVAIALAAAGSPDRAGDAVQAPAQQAEPPDAAAPGAIEGPRDLDEACAVLRAASCPDLVRSPLAQRTWRRCRVAATAEECLALAEGVSRRGTTSP